MTDASWARNNELRAERNAFAHEVGKLGGEVQDLNAALNALMDAFNDQAGELELLETKVAEYEAGRHPDDQFLAALDRANEAEATIERLREAVSLWAQRGDKYRDELVEAEAKLRGAEHDRDTFWQFHERDLATIERLRAAGQDIIDYLDRKMDDSHPWTAQGGISVGFARLRAALHEGSLEPSPESKNAGLNPYMAVDREEDE